MYEPKLSLGDSVWVMQDNKPTQLSVTDIEVSCRKGNGGDIESFVKYTLTVGHTLHESTPHSPGDFIYRTKQELIASL